jgi:hypothetical protein
MVALMRGEDPSGVLEERRRHELAVKDWRAFELSLVLGSRHTPGMTNVFRMDDTTNVGFPHFTNRDRKSVAGRRRFEMTPWLLVDEARQRQSYVYSQSGYSKGGDRWCTQMFLAIKALKESGSPAAAARILIIIGDNYSENKNNVDFAFCADIIARGWYIYVCPCVCVLYLRLDKPTHRHELSLTLRLCLLL